MKKEIIIIDDYYSKIIYEDRVINLSTFLIKDADFVKFLSQKRVLEILDLGCGTIRPKILLIIKHIYKSHNLVGIDKDWNRDRLQNPYEGYKRFLKNHSRLSEQEFNDFLENSIFRYDCRNFLSQQDDNKYDFIIARDLFHHIGIRHFNKTVKLISDKLVNSGKFYFEFKPNFADSEEDKTEQYLAVLDEFFSDYRVFIIKHQDATPFKIIFQNIF